MTLSPLGIPKPPFFLLMSNHSPPCSCPSFSAADDVYFYYYHSTITYYIVWPFIVYIFTLLIQGSKTGGITCPLIQFDHDDMSSFHTQHSGLQSGAEVNPIFRQSEFMTRLAEPSTSVEHPFMKDFHRSLGHPEQAKSPKCENLSALRDVKMFPVRTFLLACI
jgi:hypothetical protein